MIPIIGSYFIICQNQKLNSIGFLPQGSMENEFIKLKKRKHMFNKIFALLLVVGFVSACSPKTGTVAQKTTQPDPESFRKMAPKAGPAPVIQLGDYETFVMDNGLTVILVEDHNVPAVSFNLTIDEPPFLEGDKAGYAEMAGDLLATGTKNRTKAEIDESIDFIGARLSAYSGGIYGNSLTKHKGELLEIMSDVLLNPTFPEKELEKLKKQKLSALQQEKDDPGAIARNVAGILNYGKNHPYGEIVSAETVEKITRADCEKFYKTYFKPNISYLVVTGDMKLDELKKLTTKYFGSWKKGGVPRADLPEVSFPKKSMIAFVNKPGAVQSNIKITYPINMKPDSPDRIKARVANALLGGFFGSRLNKNLREDKAYTYGARSSIGSDRYIASFRAGASVRNEVTDSSIIQFMYEMNRMATEKPGAEELSRVKSVLAGQFARSMEDKATIARFALSMMKYHLPKDYYATYLQKLSAVTADDVLAMSKKYIKPNEAFVVVVGNQDDVVGKLKGLGLAGGMQYFDAKGNKIEPPKRSIAGVTAQSVLDNYIKAIGGKAAVDKIKNIKTVAKGSVQGQPMMMTFVSTVNDQAKMEVSVGGMVMQKIVYSDGKGVQEAMGQKAPLGASEIAGMQESGVPVKEAMFDKLGIKLELKGVEVIDGVEAYKVLATNAVGKKTTIYFNADTGLKMQEVSAEQGMTITSKFSDYKVVNGVKFPHKLVQLGAAPFPLEFTVSEIKTNLPLTADDFKTE